MTQRTMQICRLALAVPLLLPGWQAVAAMSQSTAESPGAGLVQRALANEMRYARDAQHPMRYRLRKSSPRLTQTKEIYETRDGGVAELVAINDQPLGAADQARENARLNDLLADPGKQQRRKQTEEQDATRALKILRALPAAFLYTYAGPDNGPTGAMAKYAFKPNPQYDPPDLETLVLSSMEGILWVDIAQERVARLEGHLTDDVDFGWGLLGKLYKGGWITMDQAPVSAERWRVVHFQMKMTGRVVFRTKQFETVEATSDYAPLPMDMTYTQAIEKMRHREASSEPAGK